VKKTNLLFCLQVIIIFIFTTKLIFAQFSLQNAFPGLSFSSPVGLYHPNDGTDRIFVVQQSGVIKVFDNNRNTTTSKTFLDITDIITSGGELGLLGLAFHPNYPNNGYFFVDYTASNPLRTVIARFQVSPTNPDSAIKSSELVILTINQPYSNHNGGQLNFGPDGYLYIGLGDGGSEGDPQGNGQNLTLLLAKILRIDIDTMENGMNYGIPPSNPFYGNTQGYREETYSYGMRNPWRFNFDYVTGNLWCGDVGQNTWEEIDLIENGGNYGWSCYEGFVQYNASQCNSPGYTFPLFVYNHTSGNCSITGGFLYRGKRRPEFYGKYVYGDYCSGKIWQFQLSDSSNSQVGISSSSILSFGEDYHHELYVCTSSGSIYEFTPAINAPSNLGASAGDTGQVVLNWTDNSSNENGFLIQRKGSNNIYISVDSVGSGVTSYTDNVSMADEYTYRIIAYNDSALSDYSNEATIIVTVVPVELISFNASVINHEVILKWETSTEKNNKGFDVDRLLNSEWQMIGYIEGHGTTTTNSQYEFKDNFEGQSYKGTVKYRLKQIDFDGSFSYSNVVSVNLNFSGLNYDLKQNYPNPFNPSTTISFDLPEQSRVKIQIINNLGQVVNNLINGIEKMGTHKKIWNAESFASGVYYVRMTAESLESAKTYSKTTKIIYLK
jgi:glucose/arabinose dehydrogenase